MFIQILMPRSFEWWFGGTDLNEEPAEGTRFDGTDGAGTSAGPAARNSAGIPDGQHPYEAGTTDGNSTGGAAAHSGARTGVTLSSEDSGGEDEVRSTPEGYVPKTPFVGMMFDSEDATLVHYNRYAKHIAFSLKIESSRKSARDGEKDKCVFVCNKSGKSIEVEETPQKERNRTMTKMCDCKAKLRVKRTGGRWQVTQFVEEHTHDVIQKFALKKYLRSHKYILKEERKFIDLLHEVNLSSDRIMHIMAELYGGKKNDSYVSKTVSNYTW